MARVGNAGNEESASRYNSAGIGKLIQLPDSASRYNSVPGFKVCALARRRLHVYLDTSKTERRNLKNS